MSKNLTLEVSVIALAACVAVPAYAQESAGPPRTMQAPTQGSVPPAAQATESQSGNSGLADIVVTAQRRSESIQKAAVAITAVSGEQLQSRGVTNIQEIGRLTAGLQVTPSAGPYSTFTVRGITQLSGNAFADPSAAVNINGLYIASPTAMLGLFYDLERVEVLKGPQGTLYGRNATAGAINLIPKRPKFTTGGEFALDIGNYRKVNASGAINLPLGQTVALRVSGQTLHRDGYFSDGTSDEKGQAARAQLLFEPTDNLSILLTGDYSHQGGKGVGATIWRRCSSYTPARTDGIDGNCFVADPYTGLSDLDAEYARYGFAPQPAEQKQDSDYYGGALNVDLKTGVGTVTFIAGYRKSDVYWRNSAAGWQMIATDKPEQRSAELRLASNSGSRLQYVFGGYYVKTAVRSRQNGENAASANFSDQYNHVDGWTAAAFSQLTYSLTDAFRVTGGLRYTYETKTSDSFRRNLVGAVGPDPVIPMVAPPPDPATLALPTLLRIAGTHSWKKINWKAGVEFDAGPRSLLYANVSTGFKAGGVFYGADPRLPVTDPNFKNTCVGTVGCFFNPETVTSYVVGSKNRFLDNRLQINAELFYLDYTDQQIAVVKTFVISGVPTSILVTENAGKSRNYGAELEADFLATPTTRLGAQVQYLSSKYSRFSYSTAAGFAPPATSLCTIGAPAGAAGSQTQLVDCSGQRGLRTPPWRLMGSIEQTIPLADGARISGEVSARYEDGYWSDVSYIPETKSYATTRINASLGYSAPEDRFSIRAYVDNLTNQVTIANATQHNNYGRTRIAGGPLNAISTVTLLPPRTWGVRGSFKF